MKLLVAFKAPRPDAKTQEGPAKEPCPVAHSRGNSKCSVNRAPPAVPLSLEMAIPGSANRPPLSQELLTSSYALGGAGVAPPRPPRGSPPLSTNKASAAPTQVAPSGSMSFAAALPKRTAPLGEFSNVVVLPVQCPRTCSAYPSHLSQFPQQHHQRYTAEMPVSESCMPNDRLLSFAHTGVSPHSILESCLATDGADALRSWLEGGGLPSSPCSRTVAEQLSAAAPAVYED